MCGRETKSFSFKQRWAETIGSKRCLSVVNGTNALNTSLAQLEIGWGDEVLVTPYTFIASVSSILFNGAIPVFVDVDPETFQMDPDKIEEKITSNTKAIIPVHILGLPCDMERIMGIANKHSLYVVEDACQAWLAEINRTEGGDFWARRLFARFPELSKNLPMGEGGAIVSNDEAFMDRCYSYHNYGNPHGSVAGGSWSRDNYDRDKTASYGISSRHWTGTTVPLRNKNRDRNVNGGYLKEHIKGIPGIIPYRLYDNVTRAAFHLFPFRYQKDEFKGLPREKFLTALRAEGVPCSSGYSELNKMPFLKNVFNSRFFQKFYSKARLDYGKYTEENKCPRNEKLCNEEAVWFSQNMLLGSKKDMDNIATAIEKVYDNAEKL